ncbi:MAG: potassium channel family protein [Acidobacteriota bacterium]
MEQGGTVESDSIPAPSTRASSLQRRSLAGSGLDRLRQLSTVELLGLWLAMVIVFASVYWLWGLAGQTSLLANGLPVPLTRDGFLACLYFSFVTATSVGFGDIVPVGAMRAVAVVEAATELLVFGILISRLLGQKQDQMIREIHQVSFEDRLGRVRVNLHLVLRELQELAESCASGSINGDRFRSRWESLTLVLIGEIRIVHDLLYKTQQHVDEPVLETLLINLAACLTEMREIARCGGAAASRTGPMGQNLVTLSRLSEEICGECVPRQYAPELKVTMDRIQAVGRELVSENRSH